MIRYDVVVVQRRPENFKKSVYFFFFSIILTFQSQVTQVLVLTVMATLVKYTTNESEVRILYEYLAEASVVFPKIFPVIHSLLDAKITNVLALCHDKTILAAVQSIIENMIACEDEKSQQQLHFLQVCN